MKCIDCGTKARRRDLHGGRCRACGRAFAFNPSRDPHPVDDADFGAALREVSADGSLFFTARQLWYALHRQRLRPTGRMRRRAWPELDPALYGAIAGLGTLVLGPLGIVQLGTYPLLGIALVVYLAVGTLAEVAQKGGFRIRRARRLPEIPFDDFRSRSLPRWAEVRGPIERLLPDPEPAAAPREVPADVAAFSFDRAVVAQHAEIAALLVANRFHLENACAVLSLDGYPFGIAETVKEMLRRNPRLTVFVLHDDSPEGARLPLALRDPAWFPDPAILVVDVGLGAGQRWMELPALPGSTAKLPENHPKSVVGWSLARDAGSRTELAAASPSQLMTMLQGAFVNAGLPGQPRHDDAIRRAALTGGVISSSLLLLPYSASGDTASSGGTSSYGDTAATDGFG